jgi:cation-transporting ATPase I
MLPGLLRTAVARAVPGEEHRPVPLDHPAHPAAFVREASLAALDLAGLGLALAGRAARLRPLPAAVPIVTALVDSTPPVRRLLERYAGRSVTDAVLGAAGAASQTLAQWPFGLALDLAHRLCLAAEVRAERAAWDRLLAVLPSGTGPHETTEPGRRPGPLRNGPLETYLRAALPAALTGAGLTLALTRRPGAALGIVAGGIPRGGLLARETFAAQFGRTCAAHDVVVRDRQALRRMDRIDTVLLDASALLTGDRLVEEVVVLSPGLPADEVHRQVYALVDIDQLEARRDGPDGWSVLPVSGLAAPPQEVAELAQAHGARGGVPLALLSGDRVVAFVAVADELDPLAEALVGAAGQAGRVVIAEDGSRVAERLGVDDVVPGGGQLLEGVRALQEDGSGVALVTAADGAALAAADIGIGVLRDPSQVPWGAHLLCRRGTVDVYRLLEALPVARRVSSRAVVLAVLTAATAGLLAALGGPNRGGRRALLPASAGAAAGLAVGAWYAAALSARPPPVESDRTAWHAMPVDAALRLLRSSYDGLDEDEAHRRAAEVPVLQPSRGRFVRATADELANPVTAALAASAGASVLVGSALDAMLITGVLAANALIGGLQRFGTDRALRSLTEASATRVRLLRGGTQREVTADLLVVGDVVDLQAGDAVPADCRVLSAEALEVDESNLTGESLPVDKVQEATPAAAVADRRSMLYEGTVVAAGSGRAVVVATGSRSQLGRTMRAAARAPLPGGVEVRLRTLTRVTLPISVGAGALLFVTAAARRRPLVQSFGTAVNLAVAAIPEGLPFVATVAELAAARRLSARGALVRRPATLEALGRVDVLCFDKTGTLTEGRITLRYVADGTRDAAVEQLDTGLRGIVAAALRAGPETGEGQPLPHPTDRAVVEGAQALGIAPHEGLAGWRRVAELPFEPGRSFHAVLGEHRDDGGLCLSVKGAPEVLLERCTSWRRDGSTVALGPTDRQQLGEATDRLARRGYRVLAVAERPASSRGDLDEARVDGLTLLGLLGLADTVRPTAEAAVRDLQQAGVEIVMVTGDHPGTAEAIAAELGTLNGRRVMTGPELDGLREDELTTQLPGVGVFARVTPGQKVRIVEGLRRAGRTVAVTGDGANDAPAIRMADVGIALGEHATDAAREAADLVVTDDRIETTGAAILEGRAMWASVRDALAILLGGNLGEIAFTLGAALLSGDSPLGTRQLLLVNLLTDVLPSMAVALRPPPGLTPDVLAAEGPSSSLGGALTRDIVLRAVATAGAATLAWLLARASGTRGRANTVGLVALISAQLGQTLVMGWRSPLVIGAVVVSFAALGAIITTPGLSQFFGGRPLGPAGWTLGLGAAAGGTLVAVALPPLLARLPVRR